MTAHLHRHHSIKVLFSVATNTTFLNPLVGILTITTNGCHYFIIRIMLKSSRMCLIYVAGVRIFSEGYSYSFDHCAGSTHFARAGLEKKRSDNTKFKAPVFHLVLSGAKFVCIRQNKRLTIVKQWLNSGSADDLYQDTGCR